MPAAQQSQLTLSLELPTLCQVVLCTVDTITLVGERAAFTNGLSEPTPRRACNDGG